MTRTLFFAWLLIVCSSASLYSQSSLTQTIRGKVTDIRTDEPLPGATVSVLNSNPLLGASSDAQGNFTIENVPVGRQSLHVTFVGYRPVTLQNRLLTSGKELVLEIKLEENVTQLEDVVVTVLQNKERAQNEFAAVSARSFTVEETERYAGSLGDPARMVANYAGVMGVDDSRNDIIIRGNSPVGLLWRLEGIDIPSPNHFSNDGATGGPISMINNNLLANSDFFTGAFPAGYGNALAGAFDLRLRNGNNRKYEFLGQIGFAGVELGAEGPFSKKSPASFIINYRYSTLAAFNLLGLKFDFGTGGAIPYYQDLNFKVNIPTKRLGRFEIFGLGGISSITMLEEKRDKSLSTQMEGSDLYNSANTGIIGFKHIYYLPNNAKLITKLSLTAVARGVELDSLQRNGSSVKWRWYTSNTAQLNYTAEVEYNQKIDAKNFVQTGIKGSRVQFSYIDSVYYQNRYIRQFDDKGNYNIAQAYAVWQHKFSDAFALNSGLHALFFPMNKQWAVEPRLSAKWQITGQQALSAAFGMHSQTQIPLFYFYRNRRTGEQNYKNLGFNRALHYVLGYDFRIARNFRLKAETYFQQIYNIPVSKSTTPQFSMINVGDDFYVDAREDLVNQGKGRNYGVELTLEKFLSRGYYFLATASLFDSKYTGSDGVWRNTKFNGKYIFNLLGGYEFTFNSKSSLLIDVKGVVAGGKWQIPIDEMASKAQNAPVYDWARAYTQQAPAYTKLNARITYRLNGKCTSQEWALDFQNLTNHKNVYMTRWNVRKKKLETFYQQGFMPMITYRILF